MKAIFVTLDVKPEFREKFIEESLLDAKGSVGNEPGCARFDIHQDVNDPNRFYLYEVYKDDDAEEAHTKMPHFLRWEKATKDWFSKPYSELSFVSVFPPDDAWSKPKV
jgi:quinol monooxygenase YgiN